jgi:hypothetical protein
MGSEKNCRLYLLLKINQVKVGSWISFFLNFVPFFFRVFSLRILYDKDHAALVYIAYLFKKWYPGYEGGSPCADFG